LSTVLPRRWPTGRIRPAGASHTARLEKATHVPAHTCATGAGVPFEPELSNFALLEKNVRLNGLSNVVLERKALSNKEGTLKLFIADKNKGDHRIYQSRDESRPSIDVEAVRLDEYLKARNQAIDVVKIDTQGAEGFILEGMTGLLEGRTDGPTIFVEFWPHALKGMGTDAGNLLKTLRSYKCQLYDFYPKDRSGLRAVDPADLVAAHSVDEFGAQTDLLLLRGGRALPKE
jgi:FkbM family methyltransferase